MKSNVCGCAVGVELDIKRCSVSMEMQAACHALAALVGRDIGNTVGLEQAADQQAADPHVFRIPCGNTRRVAIVEPLVAVGGAVEHAVVAHTFSRIVCVDVSAVQTQVVHLVLDRPLIKSVLHPLPCTGKDGKHTKPP